MTFSTDLPQVVLVGTGVVGRAILDAHLAAGVSVCIADVDAAALHSAVNALRLDVNAWRKQPTAIGDMDAIALIHVSDQVNLSNQVKLSNQAPASSPSRCLVIESIVERLAVKQSFFRAAEEAFGPDAVLCSNTSTLRIGSISEGLQSPDRVCGMHFFMPVDQRHAVEVVRTDVVSDATIAACTAHAKRIGKSPLLVRDSPGFIVNRLLSPYLNQAILLLAHGIDEGRIEAAARAYGMPMSPLELSDWIGTRTMFDAGRAFWQAFPHRIDPSPISPAMVKQKRGGRAGGCGFYDYEDGKRSDRLAPETKAIIQKYALPPITASDEDLVQLLSIPMWIESQCALESGVVDSASDFDLAMSGGLGYRSPQGWTGFFAAVGDDAMATSIEKWSADFKSMRWS